MNESKIKFEEFYMEFKEKCREYYDDLEQVKYTIENYINFLNEINRQLSLQMEKNIVKREIDKITININEKETMEFIKNKMTKISLGISKLNDFYFYLKEIFGPNVENLLNKIYIYLKSSNKNKYKNDKVKLTIIIMQTEENAEELAEIYDKFETYKLAFNCENKKVSHEIKILEDTIKKEKIIRNMNDKNGLFN